MNENELSIQVREVAEKSITVSDRASYSDAGALLVAIKGAMKKVKEYWSDPKAKAAEVHKSICAKEREMLNPLAEAETAIKREMGAFDAAERKRLAAEEERRRQDAAEMMKFSADAEASGDNKTALEAAQLAMIESAAVSVKPTAAGISTRYEWRARIVNENEIPRCWLIPNHPAIQAFAKATKGAQGIPGVEFYEEPIVSARG